MTSIHFKRQLAATGPILRGNKLDAFLTDIAIGTDMEDAAARHDITGLQAQILLHRHHDRIQELRRQKRRIRKCLGHHDNPVTFMSDHPGDRFCTSCKTTADYRYGELVAV